MAAGAVVKVLTNLIVKHGLMNGTRLAKKLGFTSKQIKKSLVRANKRANKKIDDMALRDVDNQIWRETKNKWVDGQKGPTHDVWGRQGIDW